MDLCLCIRPSTYQLTTMFYFIIHYHQPFLTIPILLIKLCWIMIIYNTIFSTFNQLLKITSIVSQPVIG